MAVSIPLIVLVLGTVAVIPTNVYAHQNFQPKHVYFNGGADLLQKHSRQMRSSNRGVLEDELKKYYENPSVVPGSNPMGDIRKWLSAKAKEYRDNEVVFKTGADGLAETPLGDISQACYDDVITLFTDLDDSKTYALKMYSSWGEFVDPLKTFYIGQGRSFGQYELCTGVRKGLDGAPFDVQYCGVQYRVFLDVIEGYVGSCWPSSCSEKDLETAYREFLELDPVLDGLVNFKMDCLIDVPWTGGAIATLCLLGFFGLIVLVGSIYHVAIREPEKTTSRPLKSDKQKALPKALEAESTYEQVIEPDSVHEKPSPGDNDTKDESVAETGINGSPPEYVEIAEDLPNKSNPESDATLATESNGVTKLVIDDADQGNVASIKKDRDGHVLLDRILMSCSVFQNTSKIFSTDAPSSMLGALNGIRVLSMWWVILGHSLQYPIGYRHDNPYYLWAGEDPLSSRTSMMVIIYGTFSVDTFFVLSGLLVTYLTLKELAKTNGRVNWVLFYVHRLWRITPVAMVVLAIYATLAIHFGKGPEMIEYYEFAGMKCQELWWTYLLYINNLYPFPGNLGTEVCTGWTWYLANDMQFFIISPVIIILLYKSSKAGISLIISMCLASFGATAYICWYWGLGAGGSGLYNNRTDTDPDVNADDDFIYAKPYCRISTYLVGMVMGFIIFKLNGKQFKLNVFVNILGWVCSTAIACSVMYGMKATYKDPDEPQTAQWLAITYNTISRFAFSLSVSWVIFVCVTGNGGYINSFLSWSVWTPLARLTFCAFLIHPLVIFTVMINMKSTFHVTYIEISYFFIASVVASYACAYLLSLLVEGPTVGFEKALLGYSKSRRAKKNN